MMEMPEQVTNVQAQLKEGFRLVIDGNSYVGQIASMRVDPTLSWDQRTKQWIEVPTDVEVVLRFFQEIPITKRSEV